MDFPRVDGYRGVCYKRKLYLAHRVAFLLKTGKWPEGDIDHINLVRDDNRWDNLRECSRSDNMKNTFAHKDSKTGVKGVTFRADTNKFSVRVTVDGAYKSFGSFATLEEATEIANRAREEFHGEFYNNGK